MYKKMNCIACKSSATHKCNKCQTPFCNSTQCFQNTQCCTKVFTGNIRQLTLLNEEQQVFQYQEGPYGRIQIGLSSINTEIPWETHKFITQCIRVEAGKGILEYMDPHRRKMITVKLEDGITAVIPQNVPHRITNTQGYNKPLKLYGIYSKDSDTREWLHWVFYLNTKMCFLRFFFFLPSKARGVGLS